MVPASSLVAPLAALTLGALSLSPAALPDSHPAAPAAVATPSAGAFRWQPLRPRATSERGSPPAVPAWRSPQEPGAGAPAAHGLHARWDWPLAPRPAVVRPFAAPLSRYGAGHRGVDLAGRAGQPVLTVDSGTVGHVGVIAGRGTMTVLHASGLRSTYEPVDPSVAVGAVVRRGQPVGTLAPNASHCAPATCLHLGALRGRTYLDPLELLGRRRVRLLPLG